jgi:hypothetical protein
MPRITDGPASKLFRPLRLRSNATRARLADAGASEQMGEALQYAPSGDCVGWGIPFATDDIVVATNEAVEIPLAVRARWLVFLHAVDLLPEALEPYDTVQYEIMSIAVRPPEPIRNHAADYELRYADGTSASTPVSRRHQINPFTGMWGDHCFEAVTMLKPMQSRWGDFDQVTGNMWGWSRCQTLAADMFHQWLTFIWCWENPAPDKEVVALRIRPAGRAVVLFGITASDVVAHPTRWRPRRKALLRLPENDPFDPSLQHHGTQGLMMEGVLGGLRQVALDLGQVIFAQPRVRYPNEDWEHSERNVPPQPATGEVIVEYTSHEDAAFHLGDGSTVSVRDLEGRGRAGTLEVVRPAMQRVVLRTVEAASGREVPVRLHVHGESDEYLAPDNHHRVPNDSWFQDYGAEWTQRGHHAAYIPGHATVPLPLGRVFVEVTRGFEVRPVRRRFEVGPDTATITVELERVLDWRSRGWVTADTHVHFLSPQTALLEGAAEDVNVVNLLAAQWGELFTNIGDFDGATTHGAGGSGGGEYLVRVGSENRQGTLGHISLLGYQGDLIWPLSAGGPMEAALGDPVNVLLTEWARRCKAQHGTVVLPHFPSPKAEFAAAIIDGSVDAVELTSLMEQARGGLNPYALADWYRYLNCGYRVAAAGGTDKMSAGTAIGEGRTYARLAPGEPFTYEAWQRAVARAETFVTFGPLIDFTVDGKPLGSRIRMSRRGGAVDVAWTVESVTEPMTRVELIVNGEVQDGKSIDPWRADGHFRVRVRRSSWIAMLVRFRNRSDAQEMIGAHTSPIMIEVEGSPFMAAVDAMSILRQIEGALAYVDTVAPRADTDNYQRLRLVLTSVHRKLHDRMHAAGVFHDHAPASDHPEHHH